MISLQVTNVQNLLAMMVAQELLAGSNPAWMPTCHGLIFTHSDPLGAVNLGASLMKRWFESIRCDFFADLSGVRWASKCS